MEDEAPGRRNAAGVVLSALLHAVLLLAFLPMWLDDAPPLSEAGGEGWASDGDV